MVNITRWETILSDIPKLYTEKLYLKGDLIFSVKDQLDIVYNVTVKNLKTCFIVDEEYLTAYWSVKPKGTGWTFTVSGDLELQKYMQQFFKEPLIRYVIATYDYGVEIISDTIPKIERMGHAP